MLRELHISNLAVITDARVEFDLGLNVFTGATGAGKSLVIGAIELLLGLRSPADMLRAGSDEGRVTGVFEIRDRDALKRIDAITDLPVSNDGGELLLVRKLHSSGRSSAALNGNPITLAMLKLIGEILVDVHGQHDSLYLLKPSNQLEVIDRYGNLSELVNRYHDLYLELADAKRRLAELSTGDKLRKQQLELLNFQADEIDKAELDAAEHAELEARSSMLANIERLRRESTAAHNALYDTDGSIVDRVKTVFAIVSDLAILDPHLKSVEETIKNGVIQLEEAAFDLSRYIQKLEGDPEELAEVNDRLNTINRLLRKYGGNVEDVLAFRADVQRQIDELSNASSNADELAKKITPMETQLGTLGKEITAKRQAAAKSIAPRVQAQLAELGMEKATFAVQISQMNEAGASGFDAAEFMVKTNPGLPEQPLRRIASGGEIGRIMLAIKSVLAASGDGVTRGGSVGSGGPTASVLVFDEIDSNIGGRLGAVIGSKLRQLAASHQVLCITHLPQIASYADRHLTVRKLQSGEKTQTSVRIITGDERVEEIAEMIGGKSITATTRAQARELLEHAAGESAPSRKPVAPRKSAKK